MGKSILQKITWLLLIKFCSAGFDVVLSRTIPAVVSFRGFFRHFFCKPKKSLSQGPRLFWQEKSFFVCSKKFDCHSDFLSHIDQFFWKMAENQGFFCREKIPQFLDNSLVHEAVYQVGKACQNIKYESLDQRRENTRSRKKLAYNVILATFSVSNQVKGSVIWF